MSAEYQFYANKRAKEKEKRDAENKDYVSHFEETAKDCYTGDYNTKTQKNIMSINVKTDGLWGNPFAIAGILYSPEGNEIDKICLRLSDEFVSDENLKQKLNCILDFPVTHGLEEIKNKAYESMLKDFADWYNKYQCQSQIIWYNGHSQSHLFREMNRLGFITHHALFIPIEVAEILRQNGYNPNSIIDYAIRNEIKEKYNPYSPLYDCYLSMEIYRRFNING